MKKIVRLTENDLMKIVKRVIKENEDFRSDMGVNPVFKEYVNEIKRMYKDVSDAKGIDELEMIERDIQYLYSEIEMSEDLSDDEKDKLGDSLDDFINLIDDMYSELENTEDEDYGTMRGRFFDKEDQEDDF